MRRRTFMEMAGLGALGSIAGGALVSGCAESLTHESPVDAAALPLDAHAMGDALVQQDSANVTSDASTASYVITMPFSVVLNDSSCSGHDHDCFVVPAAYTDDSPVSYLGGSHLVQFRPSELVRLAAGEPVPFATNGAGPGHGHCGIAFRTEYAQVSRTRMDGCRVRPPAMGQPAICTMHPST